MDRGHPKLAPQVDGLHPGILRLLAMTVEGARRHGRPVGVCGGIAGDEQAVPILIGLGVDELSVAAAAVPATKALVRALHHEECARLAQQALLATTAAGVRALLTDVAVD
jgi:phosphocarrier protein FPr